MNVESFIRDLESPLRDALNAFAVGLDFTPARLAWKIETPGSRHYELTVLLSFVNTDDDSEVGVVTFEVSRAGEPRWAIDISGPGAITVGAAALNRTEAEALERLGTEAAVSFVAQFLGKHRAAFATAMTESQTDD